MKSFEEFIHKYATSKTLRFELRPVGRTRENIQKKGLLEQDEHRAHDSELVKKIIDRYHKKFIEESLAKFEFSLKDLREYQNLYWLGNKLTAEQKNALETLEQKLRKDLADCFQRRDGYERLFKQELIKADLVHVAENDDERQLIEEFKNFTTYFTRFHKNRKNMYTDEPQATAIAYRIVHENLPRFLDNLKIYESLLCTENLLKKDFQTLEADLLNKHKLEEIFTLKFFNTTLTQTGIDFYNTVLGGRSDKNGAKIKGLNEYINLFNQRNGKRLPRLKPLYKQILSDPESASFQIESFESDNAVLETVEKFYQLIHSPIKKDGSRIQVLADLRKIVGDLANHDLSQIYLRNDLSLTTIAQELFGDWSMVKRALAHYYETCIVPKPEKVTTKYEKDKEHWLKQSHFSIQEIESALVHYKGENDELAKFELSGNSHPLCEYFQRCIGDSSGSGDIGDLIDRIEAAYESAKDLLNSPYSEEKRLYQDKQAVSRIKGLLDAIKAFQLFLKPLNPEKLTGAKDEDFYSSFSQLYEELAKITPLYNKTRNYMTQKPYSVEKYKLNFENSTLAAGWDQNKEKDNACILMRKEGHYYLGVMDKHHRYLFEENMPKIKPNEPAYEKMIYKLLPGPYRMLPKVFFSERGLPIYKPSADLMKKHKKGTYKKGEHFSLKDCHDLIDFFKASIEKHEDWRQFGFRFSPTSNYKDISDFYREVESQGYKISWQPVAESWIQQKVEEGKLYLFEIYNKDFSSYSKGRKNLHTLYWQALFDENNLKDVVYKLNGEAELFYRKKSLNYDQQVFVKGHHATELKNKFHYPIIKDRRFAYDKFLFHVPITMNFKAKGNENINEDAQEYLRNHKGIKIIGIDRGERHLLYLVLIDENRRILKQISLNEILSSYTSGGRSVPKKTDYHAKLHQKELERAKAREDWGVVQNIKELKEGYLSHVVHEVARLMVEHDAFVVMEDLNFGFKRGRFKVEKQVYQKFEKMLIDKLNYLVFKDRSALEPGGVLEAYQLTSKFKSFKDLGKQSGFVFYVPAALTSKIDPVTGFVDFLKPRYENIAKAQEFFRRFQSINYNGRDFEWHFDYADFVSLGIQATGKRAWTVVCSDDERYRWNAKLHQGKGGYEEIRVTSALKELFATWKIPYEDRKDLKEQIVNQKDKEFFQKLMWILGALFALRHNNGKKGEEERDYILSPVAPYYNSRKATEDLPRDADANGAYHIALKGLWVLQQIRASGGAGRKVKLAISNEEWLRFTQQAASGSHAAS